MSKEINQSSKFYSNLSNKRLPNYYDRDIVKILVRNPIEAFAFWGISSKTFQNVQSFLKTSMEEVFLKLHIKFFDEHSHFRENIITLPPYTDNWLMRFESPPHNLQVELVALNNHGNYMSILTSAQVILPKNRPSIHVDKIWVSPKWISEGAVTETQSGDWVLSKPTGLQNSVPATGKFVGVFTTGSSGNLGSSEKFAGSSEKFAGSSEQVAGLSGQMVTGGSSEQMLSGQHVGSSEQMLSGQHVGSSEQMLSGQHVGSSEQMLSGQHVGSSEQMLSEQYVGSSEQVLSGQYLGSSESYIVSEEFQGSSESYWLSEEFQGSSEQFLGSSGGFAVSGEFTGSSEQFGSSGNFMGSSEQFGSSGNFMGSSEHFGSSEHSITSGFLGSSNLNMEDDKKVLKG